ncbi:MAG: aminopeptidase [Actinomycetota bacterium]|nr:aminopeptidase [Actinomycetota bacterium]
MRPGRPYEMPGWCRNVLDAARLAPGEEVLVYVDEPLTEQGSQLATAVKEAGGKPTLELWVGDRPLAHAPPRILAAAKRATLSLHLAQNPRADEAAARFEVLETMTGHGGRSIYMGFVTPELLERELSQPAANVEEPARRLLAELEGSRSARIRGRAGTDLTLRFEGRPWKSDALPLEPGGGANYPGGEVFIAPLKDGADGVLVADLTVPYTVDGLVDAPVTLRFERGRVVEISGGKAAQMLRELVADGGTGADVIAELGIGLNPTVTPRGHVMLDEKAAHTAHVAIGKNTGPYGGDNDAAIHVDCVFSAPELEVDGRAVDLPIAPAPY